MTRAPDIEIFLGPSDADNLQKAIDAWRAFAEFAILDSPLDIRFPAPAATAMPLNEWPKGHLFAPKFELRWEKVDASFRTTLAKESGFAWPLPELAELFQEKHDLEKYHQHEKQFIYLWPENDSDKRLGRALRYECLASQPKNNFENVQLETVLYCDDHGRLLFWRYRSMRWSA